MKENGVVIFTISNLKKKENGRALLGKVSDVSIVGIWLFDFLSEHLKRPKGMISANAGGPKYKIRMWRIRENSGKVRRAQKSDGNGYYVK